MRGAIAAAVVLAFAVGVSASASAATFAVEPSTFTLVPPIRNATITLTNLSQEPIRLQVSGRTWNENGAGKMELTPTSGVVVFPQLFTIPPLGVQKVRAAVVAPIGSVEQAFRIVIEDLPPLAEAVHTSGMNVSIRTRFTLPVYVEPAIRTTSGRLEDIGVRDGQVNFTVLNVGNTHLSSDSISVEGRDANGKSVFAGKVDRWHVLAGGRRVFSLDIGKPKCAGVRKLTITPNGAGMTPAQTVDIAACP